MLEDMNEPTTSATARRRVESIARTAFYIVLTALFYLASRHGSTTISGVVFGVTLADYLTWLTMALLDLPGYLAEKAWDVLVNIAAGVALYSLCGVSEPKDTYAIVFGFLAFLAVFLGKITYYGMTTIVEDE